MPIHRISALYQGCHASALGRRPIISIFDSLAGELITFGEHVNALLSRIYLPQLSLDHHQGRRRRSIFAGEGGEKLRTAKNRAEKARRPRKEGEY
jgi:hypothetical protein